MAETEFDDLVIPALSALAASPGGAMTLPDLVSHLETRLGSTEETADDATSPQSRQFRGAIDALLSADPAVNGLVARGLVRGGPGGLIEITPAGRTFIGR